MDTWGIPIRNLKYRGNMYSTIEWSIDASGVHVVVTPNDDEMVREVTRRIETAEAAGELLQIHQGFAFNYFEDDDRQGE